MLVVRERATPMLGPTDDLGHQRPRMEPAMALRRDEIQRMGSATGALVLLSGSTAWYVGAGRASDCMRWLDEHGHGLLGFEGFVCDGSAIQPVDRCIADLSEIAPPERLAAAQAILGTWTGDVEWLDITTAGP